MRRSSRETYGLITMLDVVEHRRMPAPLSVAPRALLEPAGTLLVTVPAFQALWTSHDDVNHHVQRFTRRTLARLIEGTDLETVRRGISFWTCPVKLLIRLKEAAPTGPSEMARCPPPSSTARTVFPGWRKLAGLAAGALRQLTAVRRTAQLSASQTYAQCPPSGGP
jgi:hypothetical protein